VGARGGEALGGGVGARVGAWEAACELSASGWRGIAYVSLNPARFAGDAVDLGGGGYRLESVRPVGQFRWSTHVEMVGIFRR